MRWRPDLAPAAALAALVALTACGDATQTSTPTPRHSASAAAPVSPAVATPGRPYDAEDILEAMRSSSRPGGVPEELQTDEVAAAVAEQLWTVDGAPWATMSAGGSCGPDRCSLELAGSAEGAAGEDLWTFAVDPESGSVEVEMAELQSLPASLVSTLDARVREAAAEPLPDDVVLGSASWLAPDTDRFRLAYRGAGEEGSCRIDLVLDAASGDIEDRRESGC